MKKILALCLLLAAGFSVAVTTLPAPNSASLLVMVFKGTFNTGSTYAITKIINTSYLAAPMVVDSGVTYIMNGESGTTAPVGSHPASAPTYWTALP